jgi:hypothetical protein
VIAGLTMIAISQYTRLKCFPVPPQPRQPGLIDGNDD